MRGSAILRLVALVWALGRGIGLALRGPKKATDYRLPASWRPQ